MCGAMILSGVTTIKAANDYTCLDDTDGINFIVHTTKKINGLNTDVPTETTLSIPDGSNYFLIDNAVDAGYKPTDIEICTSNADKNNPSSRTTVPIEKYNQYGEGIRANGKIALAPYSDTTEDHISWKDLETSLGITHDNVANKYIHIYLNQVKVSVKLYTNPNGTLPAGTAVSTDESWGTIVDNAYFKKEIPTPEEGQATKMELPELTATGEKFLGWYTNKEFKGDKLEGEVTVSDYDDTVFYAKWCTHEETYKKNEDEANCLHEGYSGDVHCKVCDKLIKKGSPTVITGHHEIIKNAVKETCGKDGYTGDKYCKDCDELLEKGDVVKATGKHDFDEGKVTKEPTETETGVKTYTCKVCGETKTEEIAKLPKKEEPTTAAPKTEPTTEAPKTAETPKTEPTTEAPKTVKLTKAKGIKATVKKGKITVKWNKVTNAKSYQIKISKSINFTKKTTTTLTSKKLNVTSKKFAKGTYYAKVRAVKGKTYGAWSAIKKIKIK